jgi:hypothetical protein
MNTGMTLEEILQKMRETPMQYLPREPKPICVIYLPPHFSMGYELDAAMELMIALNNGFGQPSDSTRHYTDYWKDYYWFCFTKYDIEAPEFKVFHCKDFTEIQFQELRDLILADIAAMKGTLDPNQ